jgi:rfaE bifunctional protein nucleotidyltransferase chain/domain
MKQPNIEYLEKKIFREVDSFSRICRLWKLKDEKLVFTNGCFDILHRGHITYLTEAADLGTKLIVGINSDLSVKKLKGVSRPINTFSDRALSLAAFGFVDAVVEFTEDTPELLIKMITPQIIVKGGDYKIEEIIGANWVLENGGEVKIIPFIEGYSTTNFLNRIQGS